MRNNKGMPLKVPSTEEFEILSVFKTMPFDDLSISEIMRQTGKKSKPWVFNTLSKLERGGLLKKNVKGNMNLYRASLENPALLGHFLFMETLKLADMPNLEVIARIIQITRLKNYCLLVFGSYAEGEQKADSDMDICFLMESGNAAKEIRPYVNEVVIKSKIEIHDHMITFGEFVEMLLRPEENLGKQIFKKHVLAFNGDIFYGLVKEAYNRGFRG